jgi:hypothetical protein
MRADTTAVPLSGYDQLCQATLETRLAFARRDPAAGRLLEQLDSLAIERPYGYVGMLTANLAIAELREATGDPVTALHAVRRRPYHWIVDGLWGLSTYLREEGRLAALTGDTAGAILAYHHYLVLRSRPDIELVPEVNQVRAELARLEHP